MYNVVSINTSISQFLSNIIMWSLLEPYSLLPLTVFLLLLMKWYKYNSTSQDPSNKLNLPPSPPRLPLIGNLHQLTGNVHEALASVSRRYGDPTNGLVLVYVGTIPSLVVSTAETACEILKTHDIAFGDRPMTRMFTLLSYNLKDVTVAPYGEHWRQAKSILTLNLLSNKSVQTFEAMIGRVVAGYVSEVKQSFVSNKPVDLSSMSFSITNDVICMSAFGRTYKDGEIGRQFKRLMQEISEILGSFYFEDSIPQLAVVDVIRGLTGKVDRVAKTFDDFLTGVVQERLARTNPHDPAGAEDGFTPFIETLLKIQKEDNIGFTIDSDVLKALLLDVYIAATDTTASVIEWAMTEFLVNPDILKKAQDEVKSVLNGKKDITREDLEKMAYLKAVYMEITRLHPPIPVLLPHVARHDVNVMGYDIAKGTRVYVNVYAIMRNHKVWDEPDKFMPERFLESSTDFVRHNFQFLPFGAGRRACPGRLYSTAVAETALAAFLNEFDWSLPQGVSPGDVDMEGAFGLGNHKKIPLLAVGKPIAPVDG